MKPVNNNSSKANIMFFVLALFVAAGLIFVLFSSLKEVDGSVLASGNLHPAAGNKITGSNDKKLVQYAEQLNTRLNQLVQLDEKFSMMQVSADSSKNYDSLNLAILQYEEYLRKTIDSITRQEAAFLQGGNGLFAGMLTSYRSMLDSRKNIAAIRNAVAISQGSFTPDEQAMFKIQQEIMAKTNRITTLETALKEMEKKEAVAPSLVTNKQNEKFADSIRFVANINVLETKITSLNNTINALKQENDRLQKLQNDNAKNAGGSEASLKEKSVILQQRIDALNTELQLAQVDCNLSRVDAGQIISTVKQRKMLLNEASSILTNLANSGSSDAKRRAQEKIVKLNQIAANSRD